MTPFAYAITLVLALSGAVGVQDAAATEVAPPAGLEMPKKAKWDPKGNVQDAFYQAELHYRAERYDQAETTLREVLAIQAGCGDALYELAKTVDAQDRTSEAIEILAFAVSLFPSEEKVYTLKSRMEVDDHRYDDAVGTADAAIALNPKSYDAHKARVKALIRAGRFDDALSGLDAAQAEREGRDYDCLAVQVLATSGQLEAADAKWELCDQTKKKSLKKRTEAFVAGAKGDIETVAEFSRDLGDVEVARMAETVLHLRAGRYDKACSLSKLVLKVDEKPVDARLARGVCLKAQGETAEAVALLSGALNADTWESLAGSGPDAVLMDHSKSAVRELVKLGAYHLIDAHVQAEDVEAATSVLGGLRGVFADDVHTAAAGVQVTALGGDLPGAWAALEAAWIGAADTGALTGALLYLYEKDPDNASETFRTAVDAFGGDPAVE